MFTEFFVVKFVLIAIHRNEHEVKENVSKTVSGVSFDVVHCGKNNSTLRKALRARQEFWSVFAPQGRSAGILIIFSLLILWIFYLPRSLDGNSDNKFITFSLELFPRGAARWKF